MYLAKQKKHKEAEDKFKKSVFYNPLNFSAMFLWGVLLVETGRYEEAIQRLTVVLVYVPNHADALYYLAYCYSKLGNFETVVTMKITFFVNLNGTEVFLY